MSDDPLHIPTSRDYPQHELEHAVALERERICKWLYLSPWIDAEQAEKLMTEIRNGDHWRAS